MQVPGVSIILATCNGALYLREQLASLAEQTLLPNELIVGDDVSQDDTCRILDDFAATSPFPVRMVRSAGNKLGACKNFVRLLEFVGGDYLMFCDQDDVWLPDKIHMTLSEMQRLEGAYGNDRPCLVYTDLKVVAKDGTEIAPSFWRYQQMKPPVNHLQVLLAQNIVTGCTMMVNRAALKLVMPMPEQGPLMHDWWFALTVAAFGGHMSGLHSSTVLYRQHHHNDVGARAWWKLMLDRLGTNGEMIRRELGATQKQAAALLQRYDVDISTANRRVIQDYAQLSAYSPFFRKFVLARHGIHKQAWYRTVSLYFYA